jgi:CubicO group peptidase (beta-lactamase class C family)
MGELSPEKAGINREKLKNLEQYLFTMSAQKLTAKGIRTDAFVLIRGGNIVFERYGREFKSNRKHLIWSVTKSFVNTLVGMAVADGKLKVSDAAVQYYPALARRRQRQHSDRPLAAHELGSLLVRGI